jgi:Leu/Phe-tRNA-protein transferase
MSKPLASLLEQFEALVGGSVGLARGQFFASEQIGMSTSDANAVAILTLAYGPLRWRRLETTNQLSVHHVARICLVDRLHCGECTVARTATSST